MEYWICERVVLCIPIFLYSVGSYRRHKTFSQIVFYLYMSGNCPYLPKKRSGNKQLPIDK